jgi:hypothetical protein
MDNMAKQKAKDKLPAHLIRDGRFQRCSICTTPFLSESDRSLSDDFANHVLRLHAAGPAVEEVKKPRVRAIKTTASADSTSSVAAQVA